MKKNIKSFICTLLSVLLIFGMFAGCSNDTSVSAPEQTTQAETTADNNIGNNETVTISDEVQEMADDTKNAVESEQDIATDELAPVPDNEADIVDEGAIEPDAQVEQENISYDGMNTGNGLSLLGKCTGLTYYSQADSRWANLPYTSTGNKSQTMKSSACGPTCAAMVVSSSKGAILPTTTALLSVDNGYRTRNNGTAWAYWPFIADFFDFNDYDDTTSFNEMINYLKTDKNKDGIADYFVVASVGSGLFTTGGHYIVLVADNSGTITVYDPYLYNGKFNTASRRAAGVTVSGNSAFVSESSFKKYSNAKQYWIFSNDNEKGAGTTNNKKPATISVSYIRYVATQSQSLNVRSGPGTNYKVVRSLKKGSKVTVTATSGSWSQIGNNEWVSTAYLSAAKVTVSTSSKTAVTNSAPTFKVGNTYTLITNVKVRTGAGTNYAQKKTSQLTVDGRKHALNQTYAVLRNGTKFTVQQIKKNGSDIWVKIPSGWICVYYHSSKYAK
ncbi:MAG: SH3 domain-containing protein [Eubacterium sp.]